MSDSVGMASPQVNSTVCFQTEDFAEFARLGDVERDHTSITFNQSKTLSDDYQHASHGMIFARSQKILWKQIPVRGCVLMQMRFDGVLGFPGGLVDKGEDVVVALNREMEEEIGLEVSVHSFTEKDHVHTAVNEGKKLVLHFFVKEVSEDEFHVLERNNLSAEEYGIESMGIIRVPLYTLPDGLRGFPAFLANLFIGNARQQLLVGLCHSKLLTTEEIQTAVAKSNNFLAQRALSSIKPSNP